MKPVTSPVSRTDDTVREKLAPALAIPFAYPFRIFFLSLGVLAVTVVPLWLGMLLAGLSVPTHLPALQWHQHEMLFGLLEAAIAGFLLTAVCSWTDSERMHGMPLVGLWLVWLAARLLETLGAGIDARLVLAVDLAFLPLVMLDAGLRIWKARQHRQLLVLGVLAALWATHIGFHLAPAAHFLDGALVIAMTLMLVIGGRITPAFSRNWLRLQGTDVQPVGESFLIERLVLILMVALLMAVLADAPRFVRAALALLASIVTTIRLLRWRGWRVRREPLLWILHLSLAWIPIALLLMSGNAAGCVSRSAWVHAVALGAMASLILGVMSRVALGHTGRILVLPAPMRIAFFAIVGASVVRVSTALGLVPWRPGIEVAGMLWCAAFALFELCYAGILVRPRLDGRPG